MKLSAHFDLLNERPMLPNWRWWDEGGEGKPKGANLSDTHPDARRGVAIFLGCSYTATRENRIFMLTRTRPWDSPKFVRVAVGYLWTAVNKAPWYGRATGVRGAKLRGDK